MTPRRARGYTVIEVLIVLAVSGIIFVSGMTLFSGQNTKVAFEQSVGDLKSELAFRTKDVGAGQFLNEKQYTCKVTGATPRAALSDAGSAATGNEDCLVVGTAIEASPGTSDFYFYQVLGNRSVYSGGSPTGLVGNLSDANPTPAVASGTDLTLDYKLGSDAKIVSSVVKSFAGSDQPSNLVGFYIDFTNSSSGSQTTTAKAYNYQSSHSLAAVKNCIEGQNCPTPTDISVWRLCLASAANDRRAQISLSSLPTGVTIELEYINC